MSYDLEYGNVNLQVEEVFERALRGSRMYIEVVVVNFNSRVSQFDHRVFDAPDQLRSERCHYHGQNTCSGFPYLSPPLAHMYSKSL